MKVSFDAREATPEQLARLEAAKDKIAAYIREIAGPATKQTIILRKGDDGVHR